MKPDRHRIPKGVLATFVQEGRVVQVNAFFDEHHDALGIRYATAQGVGIRSTLQEVRAAFGAPAQRRARGPVEDWIYWSLGFEVSVAGTGPQTGRIVGVSVFAPR